MEHGFKLMPLINDQRDCTLYCSISYALTVLAVLPQSVQDEFLRIHSDSYNLPKGSYFVTILILCPFLIVCPFNIHLNRPPGVGGSRRTAHSITDISPSFISSGVMVRFKVESGGPAVKGYFLVCLVYDNIWTNSSMNLCITMTCLMMNAARK